jgi:hypothetical protein
MRRVTLNRGRRSGGAPAKAANVGGVHDRGDRELDARDGRRASMRCRDGHRRKAVATAYARWRREELGIRHPGLDGAGNGTRDRKRHTRSCFPWHGVPACASTRGRRVRLGARRGCIPHRANDASSRPAIGSVRWSVRASPRRDGAANGPRGGWTATTSHAGALPSRVSSAIVDVARRLGRGPLDLRGRGTLPAAQWAPRSCSRGGPRVRAHPLVRICAVFRHKVLVEW